MKRTIAIALTAVIATAGIAACVAGCAKKSAPVRQTATAYLHEGENTIIAKVDLTDGYSCEFASGAVYLYDSSDSDVAIGITLGQDVYEDYAAEAQEAADHKDIKDGVVYSVDDRQVYICKVGDNGYFGIFTENNDPALMEDVIDRIDVAPEF